MGMALPPSLRARTRRGRMYGGCEPRPSLRSVGTVHGARVYSVMVLCIILIRIYDAFVGERVYTYTCGFVMDWRDVRA